MAQSTEDADPLECLTRSLDRATAAGQWKVAEGIIRQIERIEVARSGALHFETEAAKLRGRK